MTLKVRNWLFSIAWFRVGDDLTKYFFYEKVLFFNQLSSHLMRKLFKKILNVIYYLLTKAIDCYCQIALVNFTDILWWTLFLRSISNWIRSYLWQFDRDCNSWHCYSQKAVIVAKLYIASNLKTEYLLCHISSYLGNKHFKLT